MEPEPKAEKEFEPIKSSNLAGARYDAATKAMDVRYKTGTYRYFGVEPEPFEKFRSTFQTDDSSGKHLRVLVAGLKYEKLS